MDQTTFAAMADRYREMAPDQRNAALGVLDQLRAALADAISAAAIAANGLLSEAEIRAVAAAFTAAPGIVGAATARSGAAK